MEQHIVNIKQKISKQYGILCRARRVLQTKSLITLYYSFVYPYITYCMEIWGRTFITYINALFLLQKKIIRTIAFAPYNEHTSPLFAKLEILPFEKLYEYRMIMFLYKYHNHTIPVVLNDLFVRNNQTHNYLTRNANSFKVPSFSFEGFKRSFIYNGIDIYNKAIKVFNFSKSLK